MYTLYRVKKFKGGFHVYRYFLFSNPDIAKEFCHNNKLCYYDPDDPNVVRSKDRETIRKLRMVATELPKEMVNA